MALAEARRRVFQGKEPRDVMQPSRACQAAMGKNEPISVRDRLRGGILAMRAKVRRGLRHFPEDDVDANSASTPTGPGTPNSRKKRSQSRHHAGSLGLDDPEIQCDLILNNKLRELRALKTHTAARDRSRVRLKMVATTLASLAKKVEVAKKEHAKRMAVRTMQLAMLNNVDPESDDLVNLLKAAVKLDVEIRWKEKVADQKRKYEDAIASARTSCETQGVLIAWSRKGKEEAKLEARATEILNQMTEERGKSEELRSKHLACKTDEQRKLQVQLEKESMESNGDEDTEEGADHPQASSPEGEGDEGVSDGSNTFKLKAERRKSSAIIVRDLTNPRRLSSNSSKELSKQDQSTVSLGRSDSHHLRPKDHPPKHPPAQPLV